MTGSEKIVFVDRIESGGVSGGMVRLNFETEAPVQNREKDKETEHNFAFQVVMPLSGFARSYGLLEQLVAQLKRMQPQPQDAETASVQASNAKRNEASIEQTVGAAD